MSATVTSDTSSPTSATGKRKLVYKQDPDGVFRLKKVFTDATSIVSSTHSHESDDALRPAEEELCDLSYKFKDVPPQPSIQNTGPPTQHTNSRTDPRASPPEDASAARPAPDRAHSRAPGAQPPPKKSKPKTSQQHQQQDSSLYNDITTDSDVDDNASVSSSESRISPSSDLSIWHRLPRFNPPRSMSDPRIASFVAGAVTAIAFQRLYPFISHYLLIALNLLKVGVLSGVVVGGVCWYAGVITLSDNQALQGIVDKVRAKINGDTNTTPARKKPSSKHGPVKHSSSLHDVSDADSEVTWPNVDSDDDAMSLESLPDHSPRRHSPVHPSTPIMATHNTAPEHPKTERRNTLTTITPFVAPPVQRRANTATPQLQHPSAHKPQPKLDRNYTAEAAAIYHRRNSGLGITSSHDDHHTNEPRRNSATSLGYVPKNARRRSHSPVRSVSPHKKLPPNPPLDEDLPLINEIKLLRENMTPDEAEDDFFEHGRLNHANLHSNRSRDVKRSNSTMSKTSVLGTRANYDKFLANAGSDD